VKLGVHGAETLTPKFRAVAKARAEQYAPIIRGLQRDGYSIRGIATELEKRKMPTPRGGAWHPQLVTRIVERLAQASSIGGVSQSPLSLRPTKTIPLGELLSLNIRELQGDGVSCHAHPIWHFTMSFF
jgi:hypothetical protein